MTGLPSPLPDFRPIEVDCATAVMLKILDGKCKMAPDEKEIMAALYDALKARPGEVLDFSLRQTIAQARENLNASKKMEIYELRVLAETQISRPVMKGFKARLREVGVLPEKA